MTIITPSAKWVCTDVLDDDTVHVYPDFGLAHRMSIDCWCEPRCDERSDGTIIIHEASQ